MKLLKEQKQDKDHKLKNQIRKNEELLGELQDLSEAVNLLKEDRDFTQNSAQEDLNKTIRDYEEFIGKQQKNQINKIFQTVIQNVEAIREFNRTYSTINNEAQPVNLLMEIDVCMAKILKLTKPDVGQATQVPDLK